MHSNDLTMIEHQNQRRIESRSTFHGQFFKHDLKKLFLQDHFVNIDTLQNVKCTKSNCVVKHGKVNLRNRNWRTNVQIGRNRQLFFQDRERSKLPNLFRLTRFTQITFFFTMFLRYKIWKWSIGATKCEILFSMLNKSEPEDTSTSYSPLSVDCHHNVFEYVYVRANWIRRIGFYELFETSHEEESDGQQWEANKRKSHEKSRRNNLYQTSFLLHFLLFLFLRSPASKKVRLSVRVEGNSIAWITRSRKPQIKMKTTKYYEVNYCRSCRNDHRFSKQWWMRR